MEALIGDIYKNVRSLRKKYRRINQAHISQSQGEPLNKDQEELLRSAPMVLVDLDFFEKELHWLNKLSQERSSVDENETKEIKNNQRRLCISDGITIFCLDLNLVQAELKEYRNDLQPLPITCAMDFALEGLPVSMGLFRLGSDFYMVGGHHFSGKPDLSSVDSLYHIYKKYPVMCSSGKTYRVSLADDGSRLSLSECNNIGELNRPKLWPVVVEVGGKIHAIESEPPNPTIPYPDTMPSHEVLNNNGWVELSPTCACDSYLPFRNAKRYQYYTWYHLAIGDRIYTRGHSDNMFGVFDYPTRSWKLQGYAKLPGLYSIKHVGQLFSLGYGHCAGRFQHKESITDPLYVVIAIGKATNVGAAAYLVTSSGQVLCYQPLPLFFGRVSRLMYGIKGSFFNVDAEGKTMCAVVEGLLDLFGQYGSFSDQRLLLVSTFTVEEACGAETLVSSLCAVRRDEDDIGKLPFAVEKYFVNVVTKDCYAFKLTEADMRINGTRLSACFL